jgi:hypothetical protein
MQCRKDDAPLVGDMTGSWIVYPITTHDQDLECSHQDTLTTAENVSLATSSLPRLDQVQLC